MVSTMRGKNQYPVCLCEVTISRRTSQSDGTCVNECFMRIRQAESTAKSSKLNILTLFSAFPVCDKDVACLLKEGVKEGRSTCIQGMKVRGFIPPEGFPTANNNIRMSVS